MLRSDSYAHFHSRIKIQGLCLTSLEERTHRATKLLVTHSRREYEAIGGLFSQGRQDIVMFNARLASFGLFRRSWTIVLCPSHQPPESGSATNEAMKKCSHLDMVLSVGRVAWLGRRNGLITVLGPKAGEPVPRTVVVGKINIFFEALLVLLYMA